MKKRLVMIVSLIIVSVILTAVLISGCGNESENASGRTIITVWSGQAGSKATYTKLVDEWNRTVGKEKNIYIKYEVFASTEYNDKIFDALEKGTAPEIFRIPGNKRKQVEAGNIVPIELFPGGRRFIENYGEPLLEGKERFDGQTYFVNGEVTTYALIYNKDMFIRYGIVDKKGNPKVPRTMDEYTQTARALTHPEDGCYGVGIPLRTSTYASSMFYGPFTSCIPMTIDYENGTQDFTAYKMAFEWLRKIREDKSYFPGAELLDNDMMRSQFAAGRIGMFIGASWDVGVLTQQFPTECDWDVAPLPLVDGYERQSDVTSITSGFCLGKKALNQNRSKVMEVFSFLHSPTHQRNLYEAGVAIPRVPDVMKNADLSNAPKQWAGFASQYTEISPRSEGVTISSGSVDMSRAIRDVWSGEKSPDEIIDSYEKGFDENFKKAVADGLINIKTSAGEKQ